MKVTFEFNTESETFQPDELLRVQKALDMARALYKLSDQIHHWWENADEVKSDEIRKMFIEICEDNGLDLEKLYP